MSDDEYENIKNIIKDRGYEKAPRYIVKSGICSSFAEARRVVKGIKIANGDKKVKQFTK